MTKVDKSQEAAWRAKQLRNSKDREAEIEADAEPDLKGGDGGGTSDDMIPVKDYIDARDDAVESRLSAKLDTLPTAKQMWAAALATVGGVLTIVVGALAFVAFAGDRFDAGMAVSPTVDAVRAQQAEVDKKQDAQLSVMDQKLDILIERSAKR